MQDKQGNTALHMAARRMDTDCLKILLEAAPERSYGITNNLKETPLHVAAKGKYIAAAQLLTETAPQMLTVQDTRGLTPAQWAKRCGHDVGSLRTSHGSVCAHSPEMMSGCQAMPCGMGCPYGMRLDLYGSSALMWHCTYRLSLCLQELAMALNKQNFSLFGELQGSRQTIVIAPQECHQHITAPLLMVRGGQEPPPEQINRLHVLTDSGKDFPLIVSDVCQGKCFSCAGQRPSVSLSMD